MKKDVDQTLKENGIIIRGISPFPSSKQKKPQRWMTKEEALFYLRVWEETNVPKHNLNYPTMTRFAVTSGVENSYLTTMIRDLARLVIKSDLDPITVVAQYNQDMEEVIAMSDNNHFITHYVAGFLDRWSYEVLLYLKEKEKELNSI